MSLNWDITSIDNYEELWSEVTKDRYDDYPEGFFSSPKMEDNGKYYILNFATHLLIISSMKIGFDKITKANANRWFGRIQLIEKLNGPYRITEGGHDPIYFTLEEVERNIGLKVNVSPMTKTQFLSALLKEYDL